MNRLKKTLGFTMLEIIIALGLLTFVTLGAGTYLVNSFSDSNKLITKTEVESSVTALMNKLQTTIKTADIPVFEGDITETNFTIVQMKGGEKKEIKFSLSDNVVTVEEDGKKTLYKNIDKITIDISKTKNRGAAITIVGKNEYYTLQSTYYTRNMVGSSSLASSENPTVECKCSGCTEKVISSGYCDDCSMADTFCNECGKCEKHGFICGKCEKCTDCGAAQKCIDDACNYCQNCCYTVDTEDTDCKCSSCKAPIYQNGYCDACGMEPVCKECGTCSTCDPICSICGMCSEHGTGEIILCEECQTEHCVNCQFEKCACDMCGNSATQNGYCEECSSADDFCQECRTCTSHNFVCSICKKCDGCTEPRCGECGDAGNEYCYNCCPGHTVIGDTDCACTACETLIVSGYNDGRCDNCEYGCEVCGKCSRCVESCEYCGNCMEHCIHTVTLKSGQGWLGGIDPTTVTKVTFCHLYDGSYESTWDASVEDDRELTGYLNGTEVIISTDLRTIYANENSDNMFRNMTSLKSIEGIETIDTSKVKNMQNMFGYCESLRELNLNSFDVSKVTSMRYMFSGCTSLKKLYIGSFNMRHNPGTGYMFRYCDISVLELGTEFSISGAAYLERTTWYDSMGNGYTLEDMCADEVKTYYGDCICDDCDVPGINDGYCDECVNNERCYECLNCGHYISICDDCRLTPEPKCYNCCKEHGEYIKMSFDANGGSGTMTPILVRLTDDTQYVRLPECTFTRAGYTFLGWTTDEYRKNEGYIDGVPGDSMLVYVDTTFYAVWE